MKMGNKTLKIQMNPVMRIQGLLVSRKKLATLLYTCMHCTCPSVILINVLVNDYLKPVPIEDFGAHLQRMHADGDKQFELEYKVSKM